MEEIMSILEACIPMLIAFSIGVVLILLVYALIRLSMQNEDENESYWKVLKAENEHKRLEIIFKRLEMVDNIVHKNILSSDGYNSTAFLIHDKAEADSLYEILRLTPETNISHVGDDWYVNPGWYIATLHKEEKSWGYWTVISLDKCEVNYQELLNQFAEAV